VILDTGFLVAVDRGDRRAKTFLERAEQERRALHTTEAVIAQAWREGTRQAMLARFLHGLTSHPLGNGRLVGELLARSQTSDVVDAHLAITAHEHRLNIVTGDPHDLTRLADLLPSKPAVHAWPPSP
jgi:predicted nucleic acid-binding protein